jgi:chromosome partitioning protein
MATRIIALVNQKGGVGKTTTTINLGKALALRGKKVLLVDIDPQANLSQCAGVETPESNIYQALVENKTLPIVPVGERLDLVPSDLELTGADLKLMAEVTGYFKLKNALKNIKDQYDFILVDCSPSLGILTINAIIAATELVIVLQSEYLAIKGLSAILDFADDIRNNNLNADLKITGMLMTQVNNTVLSKDVVNHVRGLHGDRVFGTMIRQNVALAEASAVGQDIFTYSPKCNGAEDYMNFANELLNG